MENPCNACTDSRKENDPSPAQYRAGCAPHSSECVKSGSGTLVHRHAVFSPSIHSLIDPAAATTDSQVPALLGESQLSLRTERAYPPPPNKPPLPTRPLRTSPGLRGSVLALSPHAPSVPVRRRLWTAVRITALSAHGVRLPARSQHAPHQPADPAPFVAPFYYLLFTISNSPLTASLSSARLHSPPLRSLPHPPHPPHPPHSSYLSYVAHPVHASPSSLPPFHFSLPPRCHPQACSTAAGSPRSHLAAMRP
jgi:hypothetical protein